MEYRISKPPGRMQIGSNLDFGRLENRRVELQSSAGEGKLGLTKSGISKN